MSARAKAMNTFTLRPMCSEAGSVAHLVTAFLTSESIEHDLVLSKVASLTCTYLYITSPVNTQHFHVHCVLPIRAFVTIRPLGGRVTNSNCLQAARASISQDYWGDIKED